MAETKCRLQLFSGEHFWILISAVHRLGRATHADSAGDDWRSHHPAFRIYESVLVIGRWTVGASVGLHLTRVAVYNRSALGIRLTSTFAKGFTDSLFITWMAASHVFLTVACVFLNPSFFSLLCQDKVNLSSTLLSEFSLWQGDSGFVMQGV